MVARLLNYNGKSVNNQFNIEEENLRKFQSYASVIAVENKKNGQITLDKAKWNYSTTTTKYLGYWLGNINKKEIQKRIDNGTYKLADLNPLQV